MFHHRRNSSFQGHGCWAPSQDPQEYELIAHVAASCFKQPHAEEKNIRYADSEIDCATEVCVSGDDRCCYKCDWRAESQQKTPEMLLQLQTLACKHS